MRATTSCESGALQRQTLDGRHFAREPDDAQAVGPVRGDLEVDDRIAAVLDRRHLEAAQADVVRDALDVAGDVDELRQPG